VGPDTVKTAPVVLPSAAPRGHGADLVRPDLPIWGEYPEPDMIRQRVHKAEDLRALGADDRPLRPNGISTEPKLTVD
jgi:hypothetical protein